MNKKKKEQKQRPQGFTIRQLLDEKTVKELYKVAKKK